MQKKILLVDDDEDFTMMNKAVLENHGYEVSRGENARKKKKKSV